MTTEKIVHEQVVVEVVEQTETETIVRDNIVVETIEIGIAGPQGPKGDQGDPGAVGGAHEHSQPIASATWTINHNLGYYPNVTALDTLGRVLQGGIAYPSVNQTVLTFSAAVAGTAYLS